MGTGTGDGDSLHGSQKLRLRNKTVLETSRKCHWPVEQNWEKLHEMQNASSSSVTWAVDLLFPNVTFFLSFLILFSFGCSGSSLLRGFSLVAASRGYSSLRCVGFSSRWLLLFWSTGSRYSGFNSCMGSAVAHGFSCSTACGIFPDQGSDPCTLYWQVDS